MKVVFECTQRTDSKGSTSRPGLPPNGNTATDDAVVTSVQLSSADGNLSLNGIAATDGAIFVVGSKYTLDITAA